MICGLNEDWGAITWKLGGGHALLFRPATTKCFAALLSLAWVLRCSYAHGEAFEHNVTRDQTEMKIASIADNEFIILRPADGDTWQRSRDRLLVELNAIEANVAADVGFEISRSLVFSLTSLMNFSFFALKHLLVALVYESAMRERVHLEGVNEIGGVDVARIQRILAFSLPIAR